MRCGRVHVRQARAGCDAPDVVHGDIDEEGGEQARQVNLPPTREDRQITDQHTDDDRAGCGGNRYGDDRFEHGAGTCMPPRGGDYHEAVDDHGRGLIEVLVQAEQQCHARDHDHAAADP